MEASLKRFERWADSAAQEKKQPLRVTVVGAGNLGHVMAGTFGARDDCEISILTRRPELIAENMMTKGVKITVQGIADGVSDEEIVGKCKMVSSDPAQVIPDADLVIITSPSNARKSVMQQITPHLAQDRLVYVGVMPGLGGFDWIADEICGKAGRHNVALWGLKDVPFVCSWTNPGVSSKNLASKKDIYLAMGRRRVHEENPVEEKQNYLLGSLDSDRVLKALADVLQNLTKINVVCLSSFLGITLTPGNPILHPSLMYGMFGPHSQWDGQPLPEKPLMYHSVSELSCYFLGRADAEVQLIKNAVTRKTGLDLEAVWPLRLNLKKVYGEGVLDNRTLQLALQTNRAYTTIRAPLMEVEGGYAPDISHRFFWEDVPFGLVILRDLADLMAVQVPMITELLQWAQDLMGKEYLVDGLLQGKDLRETGAPKVYGVLHIRDLLPEVKK